MDSCQGCNPANFNTTHPLISSWFLEGGRKAGRPVLYHPSGIALHEEGERIEGGPQYRLFAKTANLWRHFKDMQPVWSEVSSIIEFWAADSEKGHPTHGEGPKVWENFLSVSKPGVVQDPDALLIGNVNNQKSCRPCLGRTPASGFCPDKAEPNVPCICCGMLTAVEELTNMVMWSMWSAPLEIAADIRNIPNTSKAILTNKEIIAVNQDPLVYQVDTSSFCLYRVVSRCAAKAQLSATNFSVLHLTYSPPVFSTITSSLSTYLPTYLLIKVPLPPSLPLLHFIHGAPDLCAYLF